MKRTLPVRIGISLLIGTCCLLQAASQESASPVSPAASPHRALVDRYCVTCHNEKLKTAGLMLDKMDVENVPAGAQVWEKVIRKLRAGAMPPAGLPRPDPVTYDAFASYLETEIDGAAAAHPNPGRPAIRRLNRAEYANAIRDLLAMNIDGETLLPTDESSYGFDNVASVLTVSPMLMERYMLAAARISRLAVGDPSARPSDEEYATPKRLMQDERASEDLPFGSRGGIAVHHDFPADGEYVIKITLQRDCCRGYIRGLGEPHQLDVRLDGLRVQSFTVGGEHRGKSAPIFSSAAMGETAQEDYEHTADENLEVRITAQAGPRVVGVAFVGETVEIEGPLWPEMTPLEFDQYKGGDPAVASIMITGPFNAKGLGETPSRRKIFVCHPVSGKDEEPCARKVLATLAHHAYRRPVLDEDLKPLLSLYEAGRSKGGFEAGIETALERILAGPEFLFRFERDPAGTAPGGAYRLSDLELASRLSFFLWSSIPDDELLDLAAKGKLNNPVTLEQQVRRMLADSRADALVDNFAAQWLALRNLKSITPDPIVYPEFDDNLREAFEQEARLFFKSVVREDRSVVDFLDADYTFVNERLARFYGIPNVYGSQFRRVTLSDPTRRGLLGKGSVLMATSYPNRTSPVSRGKWVLENVLGTPPPPPPPNVPSLKDNGQNGKMLSMRQRMEEHRKNPACAVCHKLMDPLGFSLENFDGLGKWRTKEGNNPVDPSGALPDGTPFQGPNGLREALLKKREQFVNTFLERLLTYALGRGVEYYDAPVLRQILREAAPNNYRWSSLVLGIVKSTPFQMRRSPTS
jgi:uncharacterized protein DUF1592/uncharacterized protein DUF1588/uncharacterized protein DUF1585/uncharacterized protein DUF1587/uncharacterized protein DUF1595/cytochrome c